MYLQQRISACHKNTFRHYSIKYTILKLIVLPVCILTMQHHILGDSEKYDEYINC